MKYTEEEVRAKFEAFLFEEAWLGEGDKVNYEQGDICRMWASYKAAYAERIEADEEAVPAATSCADHAKGETGYCTFHTNVPCGTNLFVHPPAQAAQVDPAAKPRTLTDFVHTPDAERARTGQQVAARVDEMMAEPVAQDDPRIGFFEGLARAAREKGYAGIAEAITAAPTAPSLGEPS